MALPSPDMSGPENDPSADEVGLPAYGHGRDDAPDAAQGEQLVALFRSCDRREELELRAAVVMFCNNAADIYQALTPDELDECREVETVRNYLHAPGFSGIDNLKERFYAARRLIREEADGYLGHAETVDQLVTFFDSYLLAEAASCVMSEVIMNHARAMNADIQDLIVQPFLEGINEQMSEVDRVVQPSGVEVDNGEQGPAASLLREQVEIARRTLGASLREHLKLKVRFGSLVEEAMNLFSTHFCSSCNIDSEYLIATEKNLVTAFRKPFEDVLVNSYTSRYGQIMQVLVGIGALKRSDTITPSLENDHL